MIHLTGSCLFIALFSIASAYLPPQAGSVVGGTTNNYIWTEDGAVRGQTAGNVENFLGIPYAAPPVGGLRWKAPIAVPRWHGVRDATSKPSECTQIISTGNGSYSIAGSEDCLYLNVYRPGSHNERQLLPVLIFIHGGSNQKGSGNDYDPSALVAKTGIIVVTINYRLNVFGFMALPSLDAEVNDSSSGNFGLLDQQAVMRWVHANIRAFGGNPSNVTIDGESAGGIDICANLVSPLAAGLFKKAIMQSMYCPVASHEEAIKTGVPVAIALGCTDSQTAADCMRAKAAADVLDAAGPLTRVPGGGSGFNASPNFGGRVLPLRPLEALSAGAWNRSSILLGSNHDELALIVAAGLLKHNVKVPLSAQAYQFLVKFRFGSLAPAVLNEYPLSRYRDPFLAFSDEITDNSPLGCDVSSLAQMFSMVTETFRYEFDDPEAPIPTRLSVPPDVTFGAYHGSELQYLFKMTQLPGPNTDEQRNLSDQMMEYWANFAKTGNPNGPQLPYWPRYDSDAHQSLSFRPGQTAITDDFDLDHHCAFWATVPQAASSK